MKYRFQIIAATVLLSSCGSDTLSNSKAEDIIETCLEATPEERTSRFRIGKTTFRDEDYDKELLGKYVKLMEDGYLNMTLLKESDNRYGKTKEYEVKLTEKALDYMDDVPENEGNARAKAFKYEVDEVLEVHETPATNTAVVRVNFKAVDITPFAIFSKADPAEFWVKTLQFSKTSNGWKYCDGFN